MPYLYNYAIQAHQLGHPLQRAMILEFYNDRTTHHLDRQYTLGPSLLVAPVFVDEKEETEYYVPAGRWTSFFHPTRAVDGPTWVKETVALNEIPVWVRPGTVLLLGPTGVTKPDYELNMGLEVRAYELGEAESVEVNVPTGQETAIAGSVRVERKGLDVKVFVIGQAVEISSIALHLKGYVVSSAKGGNVEQGKVIVGKGAMEVGLMLTKT